MDAITNIKVDKWQFDELIIAVKQGKLRIPQFQRDFVWEKSRVIKLLESIYNNFPIGSFFFWIAPEKYNLFYRNIPELGIKPYEDGDELRFILDGQQRITSLYVAIEGLKINNSNYSEICFDLDKEKFIARKGDHIRYIPFCDFFGKRVLEIYNELTNDRKIIFDKCKRRFQEYPFSIIIVKDKNLEDVCTIFERINQGGKRLNLFDLVVAASWKEDFDLKKNKIDLDDHFFDSFGSIKPEIYVQALSLIIKKQCTRAYQLRLTREDIKNVWADFEEAFKKAVDFIRNNLGVKTIDIIPYPSLIALITYFFYNNKKYDNTQKEKVEEWFWKCSFSERYSGTTLTKMGEDRAIFDKIIRDEDINIHYPINIDLERIKEININSRSALRNAILCLLAKNNPISFKENSPIYLDKDYFSNLNSSEKHHIFPKNFLYKQKIKGENSILNFCFIPSQLNKEISKKSPKDYFIQYKQENDIFDKALKTHLIPSIKDSGIWTNDFPLFINQRAELIEKEIRHLVGEIKRIEKDLEDNPAKVLGDIERQIREKIHINMYESYGEDYWDKFIPQDIKDQTKKRIEDAIKKQPFVKEELEQAQKKLDFCNLLDYLKIILKNWKVLEDVFGSKEQLEKHFKNLSEYRNAIAHPRDINSITRKEGEIAVEWFSQVLLKEEPFEEETENFDEIDENELYTRLKETVDSLDDDIVVEPKKHYIAFKIGRKNFLAVALRSDRITMWIRGDGLKDPQSILKDVSDVGHLGTGRYEFNLSSISQLDEILPIIEQAYQQNKSLIEKYDINSQLKRIKDKEVLDYLSNLRQKIKEVDDKVEEHITKNRIIFGAPSNFCSIGCRKNYLRVAIKINVNPSDFQDLRFYDEDEESWDYLKVDKETPINSLLKIIKLAYDKNS